MASRVLFELILFLTPFALFGLYRLAVTEAEQEGRKPWPIKWLFGVGFVFAVGTWIVLILLDRGERDICYTQSRFENGKVIPGEEYPCEKDLTTIGTPRTEDPGGIAEGLSGEALPDE